MSPIPNHVILNAAPDQVHAPATISARSRLRGHGNARNGLRPRPSALSPPARSPRAPLAPPESPLLPLRRAWVDGVGEAEIFVACVTLTADDFTAARTTTT